MIEGYPHDSRNLNMFTELAGNPEFVQSWTTQWFPWTSGGLRLPVGWHSGAALCSDEMTRKSSIIQQHADVTRKNGDGIIKTCDLTIKHQE